MSESKSFFVVQEPNYTVVVDAPAEAEGDALKIVMFVRMQAGVVQGAPGTEAPPKLSRQMLPNHFLTNMQEYQRIRYWVIDSDLPQADE